MARQDPRYRGPEECKDAKRTYSIEACTAKMDWPSFLKKAKMQSVHTLLKLAQLRLTGHVTRMPDERLPKKVLYENCKKESAHKVAKETLQRHP